MRAHQPRRALCVAVLGAESTGKTTLAQALQQHFAAPPYRLRVAWVPEALRDWCKTEGRTPRQHEQLGILRLQGQRIDQAASQNDLVICDTTGLMTAVYSEFIFGDSCLNTLGLAAHDHIALTLLTAPDLPWVPDGHQRDGAHVQAPVDQALRKHLAAVAAPFVVVSGTGGVRLASAIAAVDALLHAKGRGGVNI